METKIGIDSFYCDAVENGFVPCVDQCVYCCKVEHGEISDKP